MKINWKYYITLFGIAMFGILIVIWTYDSTEINGEIDCEFNGIEYVNVSPAECWNEDISSGWCPLPKDIHCKMSGRAPMSKMLFIELMNEMG